MKIARRKRAQAGNWAFNPGNAEMCVSNQVEPIFSGLFSSGLCQPFRLSRRIAWMNPSQKAARNGQWLIRATASFERAYKCTRSRNESFLGSGAMAVTVGMTALLSLLKARATFALELNFEQKLIYIYHRWTSVSRLATL